jgi:hypothetical protein
MCYRATATDLWEIAGLPWQKATRRAISHRFGNSVPAPRYGMGVPPWQSRPLRRGVPN